MAVENEKPFKPDSPQAVVQTGTLGFYPLNGLGLTALLQGHAHIVVASREDTLAPKLRAQTEFVAQKQTVPIQGKVYAGLSDAFYRGKLPEVLLVTSDMLSIPAFLEEFLDFLDKLTTLGFLSSQTTEALAVLDQYIPQVVIASYGIVYDVVLEKLSQSIRNIDYLSARQRERLLQKFSRALFVSPAEAYLLGTQPTITLFKEPMTLKLAGAKSIYLLRTTQVIDACQIPYEFNPNADLGILEYELNLAYLHLCRYVFPLFAAQGVNLAFSVSDFTTWMEAMGQTLKLLPGLVTADSSSAGPSKKKSWQSPSYVLSTFDLALVHQLKGLSEEASCEPLSQLLDALLKELKTSIAASNNA